MGGLDRQASWDSKKENTWGDDRKGVRKEVDSMIHQIHKVHSKIDNERV